mgnify:CR=1 FL=1
MEAIKVVGANLLLSAPDSWERVSVEASSDAQRLACIYQTWDGFRVQRHIRGKMEPQWKGKWWVEDGRVSIADTLDSAQALAASYPGMAA